MAKALSKDIRDRIITYYNDKVSIRDTAQFLQVSKSSVDRIRRLYRETGSYVEKSRSHTGRKREILTDLNALKAFVKETPDMSGVDMAKHFGCSAVIIGRRLAEAGFTYKKNIYLQRAECSKKTGIPKRISKD